MAMTNPIKTLVSKKKRRFIEDGYNLDLTYISGRVIAMGYPSENLESMYRNKLEDVKSLLEQKHKDHYKIYNLCSERSYDIQKFHSRVAIYPFDDHNPPEFGQMKPFCEDVDKWLDEHDKNVAVVHCKAGKGRTGLMICAYLLHRREYKTAEDVLSYYGSMRTQDQKGVTIPSQRRYVDYYSAMMNESLQYNPVKMYLTSIVIDPLPQVATLGQHEGYIQFEVRQTSVRPFQSDVYVVHRTDGRINIELQNPLLIVGDVKIEFTQKNNLDFLNLTGRPRYVPNGIKLFHFWVNTFFIDQHRSTHLTHDSTVSAPRPSLSVPLASRPEERNCRSTHNSGSGLDSSSSPLPPPRKLGPSLSSPHPRTREDGPLLGGDYDQETHSPNGSCLSSMQTIHSHPPARTVSIAMDSHGHQNGRRDDDSLSCDIKHMSISDDFLQQAQVHASGELVAEDATHKSFMEKRHRHSSVPQTARTTGSNSTLLCRAKRNIPAGKLMSVRLNKSQIDKAAKDKSGKFSDNFNVTLFLVRPNDQTLQAEFSRSNLICQGVEPLAAESSEESSEEEQPEFRLGARARNSSQARVQSTMTRTLTAPISGPVHGMVRNSTEPGPGRLGVSMAVTSQSTWI
jgi:phosphatidylinositol-3,4,5-trisphosphate 3-phosphatase/dual-specificity protein phosphatase PTEN